MALEEITVALFATCNSIRVLAYVPQLLKVATDENGASAVSSMTWLLFLTSHISTVAYALVNRGDWAMASMFLANALACAAILVITAWRRNLHRKSDERAGGKFAALGGMGRVPVPN
jgi:hypothetical protein